MVNFLQYIEQLKIDSNVLNDMKVIFNKNDQEYPYLNKLTENEDYINIDNVIFMTFSSFYYCLINMKLSYINDIGLIIDTILKVILSNQNSPESSDSDELYKDVKEVLNNEEINSNDNSLDIKELLDVKINDIDKEVTLISNEITILKDDIPIANLNYSNTIDKLDKKIVNISDNIALMLKNIENIDSTTNYIKNNTEGMISNINKMIKDVNHINQTYKL